jgi:hypothetical protein
LVAKIESKFGAKKLRRIGAVWKAVARQKTTRYWSRLMGAGTFTLYSSHQRQRQRGQGHLLFTHPRHRQQERAFTLLAILTFLESKRPKK